MPITDFNATDPNSTYLVPHYADGISIDTSLPPVFQTATEYGYYTFLLWQMCTMLQGAVWDLGYRDIAGNIPAECFEFLHSTLSTPFRVGNQLPDREPLTMDVLPTILPFRAQQRKKNFLEVAAEVPCHGFVDGMSNAFYEGQPLRRLQRVTRSIGPDRLQLECAWQAVFFAVSIFFNMTAGWSEPFSFIKNGIKGANTANGTEPTKVPSAFKAYAIAKQLLLAVKKRNNIIVNDIKEDDFFPNGDCVPGVEKMRLWGFQVINSAGNNTFWFITNQIDAQALYDYCKRELKKGNFSISRPERTKLNILAKYLRYHVFPHKPTLCTPEDLLIFTTTPCTRRPATTTTKSPQRRDLDGLQEFKSPVLHQFHKQNTSKPYALYGKPYMRGTTVRRQHNLSQPRPGHR